VGIGSNREGLGVLLAAARKRGYVALCVLCSGCDVGGGSIYASKYSKIKCLVLECLVFRVRDIKCEVFFIK